MTSEDISKEKLPANLGMKNVLMLGLVSFFTDFSTEMILGVLPLFIVNNLGASRAILGAIEGSAELTSYAFRMISGSLSDRIRKRKVFVLIGYGLSTVCKPFFFIATAWIDAFIVRTVDRIGKGVRTAPRDALIADSVKESISGKAFGVHRTIDQIGAIVGPLTAFAILQVMDIRAVFLFSLIPGSIAVITLIYFVKEISLKKLLSSSKPATIIENIKDLLNNNKPFVVLLVITGVFSLGAFNYSFIYLKTSDLGISQSTIPIVYASINITHTIIGIPAGLLVDKIGKEKVLIVWYSIFALSSILMALYSGNNYLYAYFLAPVFGLYVRISEIVQWAVISKFVSADLRGIAYGLYNLVTWICFFISNIAFGYLWDAYSVKIAVVYTLFFSVFAIGGMIVFVNRCSFYPQTLWQLFLNVFFN